MLGRRPQRGYYIYLNITYNLNLWYIDVLRAQVEEERVLGRRPQVRRRQPRVERLPAAGRSGSGPSGPDAHPNLRDSEKGPIGLACVKGQL